jgi:uncharacterized membrane protein SirB2
MITFISFGDKFMQARRQHVQGTKMIFYLHIFVDAFLVNTHER